MEVFISHFRGPLGDLEKGPVFPAGTINLARPLRTGKLNTLSLGARVQRSL